MIVHAGQNNVLQEDSVDIPEWQNQMQLEVKALKSKLSKFKKSVVVGVPPAPSCKKSTKTKILKSKSHNE